MARAFATPETADNDREQVTVSTPAPVRRTAAPLVVGAADDRAEVEADRVADEVINRLQGGEGGESHVHDGCHGIARKEAPTSSGAPEVGFEGGAISDDLTSRIEAKRGGGSALPDDVRRRMETGFGHSLADVRVHTDGEAATLNRSISARAFTTGNDIFFGSGEFSPGSAAGERVLAHEIAHTRQQGGGARRIHRKWDLNAKNIDWSRTQTVGTVDSGQAVYILDDGGSKIVVKTEDSPIGLAELSGVMHDNLSAVKSVRHRKVDKADKAQLAQIITSADKLDRKQWGALGAAKRKVTWLVAEIERMHGKKKGDGIDDVDDVEVGRIFHQFQLQANANASMMAMDYADGQRAQEAGKETDRTKAMEAEPQTRMRNLLTDFKHMENLGQLTAVDIFLNNHDRVMKGNVGNWFYDPWSTAITVIDHVDAHVPAIFKKVADPKNTEDQEKLAKSLGYLGSGKLGETAAEALDGLIIGVSDKSKDADLKTWMDADGGYRRALAEEALERGLEKGRKLLVKTFTATRFSLSSSGKNARKVKKAIKKAAVEAFETDRDEDSGPDSQQYYKVLKARAEWLKKN